MEINNKIIQGIFKYSPDVKFTKGDFIVGDDLKLYIVKENSVIGIPPHEDTSFRYYILYMSDEVVNSDDDISNYIKEGTKDKLVTAYSVGKMLSSYLSGFDEKGIITNEVMKTGEIYLRDYFGNQTSIGEVNPLDEIMKNKDLNNAVFKVSKEISKGIMGSVSDNLDTALLRQYTYYNNSRVKIRVQELIDIDSGMSMFRHSSEANGFDPTNSWTCSNVGNKTLEMINSIISYYSEKSMNYEKELQALKSSFRFREVPFTYKQEGNETEKTLSIATSSFPDMNGNDELLVTICVSKKETTTDKRTVYRTGSLTININTNSPLYYKTLGDSELSVVKKGNELQITTYNGLEVKDIYYKQYL